MSFLRMPILIKPWMPPWLPNFEIPDKLCICADRFLVHSAVHDEFVAKLVAKVEGVKVGAGMDPETQMGPLISSQAVEKVAQKVERLIQV